MSIRPKLGMNALSCTLMLIGAILLFLLLLAFLITKSGLLAVPILSRFYHGPTPIRLVQSKPITWDEFRVMLASRIYEQRGTSSKNYTVQLSEQEISGLLLDTVETALRSSKWKVEIAQTVVTPSAMELYLKVTWSSYVNVDLLFSFKPVVDQDGDVQFDVISVRLGDYPLPPSWGKTIAGYVFSRDLGSWEINIGGQKGIQSISLLEKGLNIILNK